MNKRGLPYLIHLLVWHIYAKLRNKFLYYKAIHDLGKKELSHLSRNGRESKVIVSMTSYGNRLAYAHLSVYSILCQTVRPDKIIIYFGEDVNYESLPEKFKSLEKYGVKFEFRQGNIKAHKKYYYVMKEYPNSIVITIDDDLIYPEKMIQNLLETSVQFPNCVIANRAHKILFNKNCDLLPYNEWEWETKDLSPSNQLFATGGGGTLYPPGILNNVLGDKKLIEKLSLNADDVWLKICEMRNGIKVKLCEHSTWSCVAEIPFTQKTALGKTNVDREENDLYLRQCMDYYGIKSEKFLD